MSNKNESLKDAWKEIEKQLRTDNTPEYNIYIFKTFYYAGAVGLSTIIIPMLAGDAELLFSKELACALDELKLELEAFSTSLTTNK